MPAYTSKQDELVLNFKNWILVKKLIPLLKKGESIFCHYKLLKEAIKLGAVVEVVSGISFKQKYLFRNYIAVLAKLRANTTNEAHARSLKLLSNALFGKLLQSVLKYNRNFCHSQ